MTGAVFLEGEKVNLRTVEEEDIEFLRDGVNHPKVRIHLGTRRPQNLEKEENFFEEQVSGEENIHLLISREEKRLGIISLMPRGDEAERTAEIGIWLHPDHHGNGYGSEAAKIITRYGFNQLNFHKIYARAHADNQASRKVWKKLDFKKEGTFRDHTYLEGEYKDVIYYGILKNEWQK